jgi:D-alanyl-D-alanine endopeptidase (penicillin-binding protein 7)
MASSWMTGHSTWVGLIAAVMFSIGSASGQPPTDDGIQLASVHAVVGNLASDEIVYAKRDEIVVPIASLTKLMTAMVVLDGGQDLEEWIPIVPRRSSTGKNGYSRLRVDSESTRGQLLRLALMSSENLASWVLATHYPGGVDAFTRAMNDKAGRLGMERTHFDDPTGLSLGNRSTATDLWKMVRAAYRYDAIREYSTTYQFHAIFRNPRYALDFGNTNPLTASSKWEVALTKTGYLDEAGRCLAMVAEIDGEPYGIVLLNAFGTRTPLGDAARVRRWLRTGSSGTVAGAALEYERRVAARYDPSDRTVDGTDTP